MLARIALAAALALAGFATITAPAEAGQIVRGHFRSNGTYVAPYFRSSPDGHTWNNYGGR